MALHDVPLLGFAADLVCPERCASCETIVDPRFLFCAACWGAMRVLGPPECMRCGTPGSAVTTRCAPCLADTPIRMARAFAAYERDAETNPLAHAIARFKYGGGCRLGRRFATTLTARVPDAGVDLVVPVPLHPRRLRERGYNQSAVLARHLARHLDRPVALHGVIRNRDTPSQVGLGPRERARNVAGVFGVRDQARVQGRRVLVVDDVWTSGSTVQAVAAALHTAGAETVDVLTIARVL